MSNVHSFHSTYCTETSGDASEKHAKHAVLFPFSILKYVKGELLHNPRYQYFVKGEIEMMTGQRRAGHIPRHRSF